MLQVGEPRTIDAAALWCGALVDDGQVDGGRPANTHVDDRYVAAAAIVVVQDEDTRRRVKWVAGRIYLDLDGSSDLVQIGGSERVGRREDEGRAGRDRSA